MLAHRVAGGTLLALVIVPWYLLLDPRQTGLAGSATLDIARDNTALLWSGLLLALAPAILVVYLVRPGTLTTQLRSVGEQLARPSALHFALACALLATSLSAGFALLILGGQPTLIDAVSQLVHARYLAAGLLAGPAELAEFWQIQNTIVTEHGWLSMYPPGHPLLLALGFRLGAVWAIGPLLAGITVFFGALVAERLLERRSARLGALLLAFSPLLLFLAGAYMNHVTAAAFWTLAVYCALRARAGRAAWALGSGCAIAGAFATRPLAGLLAGTLALGVALFGPGPLPDERATRARRAAAFALGAAPVLLALAWYNDFFFGSPFRFGYTAALGPQAGLGWHQDPWGNAYGARAALAYTSSDLLALGVILLETPLSAVLLVGTYLMVTPRLSSGERVLGAWALGPVVANLFYWHHGLYMGPRLLAESVPAWAFLAAAAAVALVRAVPPEIQVRRRRLAGRDALATTLVAAAVAGILLLGPQRALSYRPGTRATFVDPASAPAGSLVFVHGSWPGRIGMRLAAARVRLDVIETALRQNSTCRVQQFADALERGAQPPALDLTPRAHDLPATIEIAPAVRVRTEPAEQWTPACAREAAADRHGGAEITPLLWRGALPGLDDDRALFVRDLGPDRNARLLARYADRTPLVLVGATRDQFRLLPYDEGMHLLWGAQPARAAL